MHPYTLGADVVAPTTTYGRKGAFLSRLPQFMRFRRVATADRLPVVIADSPAMQVVVPLLGGSL